MTEQDLIDLSFNKVEVPTKESGEAPFHYYEYNLGHKDYGLTLISNDDNTVEIFDYEAIKFTTKSEVEMFIGLIKRNIPVG